MTKEEFEQVFKEELALVTKVLVRKRNEYTPEVSTADCLKNFKNGSSLMGSPELCLCSYLLKHIVSIFDMAKLPGNYEEAVWTEKITDSINYLFLLKALIAERNGSFNASQSKNNSKLIVEASEKKS